MLRNASRRLLCTRQRRTQPIEDRSPRIQHDRHREIGEPGSSGELGEEPAYVTIGHVLCTPGTSADSSKCLNVLSSYEWAVDQRPTDGRGRKMLACWAGHNVSVSAAEKGDD